MYVHKYLTYFDVNFRCLISGERLFLCRFCMANGNQQKYFVCSRHFTEDAMLPQTGRRSNLKANALPSLYLTGSMFN